MRSLFPPTFAVDAFSEIKLQFHQRFLDLNESAKKMSIFPNPFNWLIVELSPNFQLEIINLQCNNKLNDKYQQKTLIELYKCLSRDQHAQLKSYTHELLSVLGSTFLYEKIFSKIQYSSLNWNTQWDKIFLQISINIWALVISIDDRPIKFESKLREILSPQEKFHSSPYRLYYKKLY